MLLLLFVLLFVALPIVGYAAYVILHSLFPFVLFIIAFVFDSIEHYPKIWLCNTALILLAYLWWRSAIGWIWLWEAVSLAICMRNHWNGRKK